jgi:hypothetical protein
MPSETRSDPFPIFGALLNALHSGVAVRILTDDYRVSDCEGMISALPFLVLNGAQVRYFASTTYLHAKYVAVDSKSLSISSIDYTNTSYNQNREAGVVFEGDSQSVVAFTESVFNNDWALAVPLTVNQTYSAADMAIITNNATVPIVQPPPFSNPKAYITPTPTAIELSKTTPIRVFTSPDYARNQIFEDLDNATQSFAMYIYQVRFRNFLERVSIDLSFIDRSIYCSLYPHHSEPSPSFCLFIGDRH